MAREENKTVAQIITGAICGTVMIVCALVYVILGITLPNFWHPGWLIMFGGAMTCAIVGIVTNTVADLKQHKKQAQENNDKE